MCTAFCGGRWGGNRGTPSKKIFPHRSLQKQLPGKAHSDSICTLEVHELAPSFSDVGFRPIIEGVKYLMCAAKAIPELRMTSAAVRNAIINELSNGSSRPTELLEKLGDRFSDFEVKEALLNLLHEGTLVMTSDRQLKISGTV
jgi:hypothetical protein